MDGDGNVHTRFFPGGGPKSDFFAFLQDYYVIYYGKIATGEDFFNTLRKHTSIDLDPILKAYFANTDL